MFTVVPSNFKLICWSVPRTVWLSHLNVNVISVNVISVIVKSTLTEWGISNTLENGTRLLS